MKDKFLKWLDKIYVIIYKSVVTITYFVITKRKCRNCTKISRHERKEIKQYWRKTIKKRISCREYNWYKSKDVKVMPEIIPDLIWHSYIEPYYNSLLMEKGFKDKNYFETIIGRKNSPDTVLHCINGQLLDEDYLPINNQKAVERIYSEREVICKPSIDSGGGRGICFIKAGDIDADGINDLTKKYEGNFIIQKILKQHKDLNKLNPNSLNTMRIVSFLYKGEVHIISRWIRVANSNSRLDNISSGGYYFPINDEGILGDVVIDEDLDSHDLIIHNKTDKDNRFKFSGMIIPNWNEVIKIISENHYKLPHFRIINWDVAIKEDGIPVIIEYNLIDASVSFHQLHTGPIFGDLTDDVLKEVFGVRNKTGKV